MKKLIACVLILGSLFAGAFGKENEGKENYSSFSVVFPIWGAGDGSLPLIGVDYHDQEFSSDFFGFFSQSSFSVPLDVFKSNPNYVFSFMLDGSWGVSFRLLDTSWLSCVLSAGVTANWFMVGIVVNIINVGVCADAALNLKLTDSLYITGGVQCAYYPVGYLLAFDDVSGVVNNSYTLSPRIGITFR